MKKLPLRKQIIMGLIMGGVAFGTSALFAFWQAAAGVPAEKAGGTWIIGLCFGTVASTVYLMLAGNKRVVIADKDSRRAALAAVADGSARVLIYRQGFVGKLAGVDVYVDGAVRTQLKSPRFAVLDLAPGRHLIETEVQGRRSDPMEVVVAANEIAAVQVVMSFGKTRLIQQADVDDVRATLADVPMVTA